MLKNKMSQGKIVLCGCNEEVLKIGMGKVSHRVSFPIPIFRISDPFRECEGEAGKWWRHV